MYCIKCGGTDYRKNRKTKGKQRYRCVACGYNFTNTHGRGKPPELRLQALRMYTENMGLSSIGRLLGVDAATVMHWVRDEGKKLMDQLRRAVPESLDGMDIIEIDEMWHYIQKNCTSFGYGLLYLATPGASSPSKLVLVAGKRSSASGQE